LHLRQLRLPQRQQSDQSLLLTSIAAYNMSSGLLADSATTVMDESHTRSAAARRTAASESAVAVDEP